jgi:eukaryotic-like serine/threonine-protein kinase
MNVAWRKASIDAGPLVRGAPGYRDSGRPIFATGEVVSSTYQIRELLHGSDRGQVFEAWDMMLERVVALEAAWRDPDVPPLLHQARATSAIDHDCTARIVGLGHHHGTEFLVAERIVGPSLREHVAASYAAGADIPAVDALDMLAALAHGLAAVHRAGQAARRLGAGNIIRLSNRRLVLSRFALGQGQSEAEAPIVAPEVVTGAHAPEPGSKRAVAADLYALGCVAMELCTGKPPFEGQSTEAVQFAHVHERPPRLAAMRQDLPMELGDLMDELLAKRPASRPASAAQVGAQLDVIARRAAAMAPGMRVLVGDDRPERVRRLWSLLRRAHARAEVDAAASTDEVAQKLAHDEPALLVLSPTLPGSQSGLALCDHLGRLPEPLSCTIVVVSAAIDELSADDAAALGELGIGHVCLDAPDAAQKLARLVIDAAEPPAS